MKILFADDSRLIRERIVPFLEELGYEVDAVEDGQELLDRLEAVPDRFDLIITDNNMPRLTGLEILRRLKAGARFRQLPIVVYSAGDSIKSLVELLGGRFVDKTGSIEDLIAVIGELAK